MNTDTIYTILVAAGAEIDHHETDMYVKKTPEVDALIAEHGERLHLAHEEFRSEIDGEIWIDLPFQYVPAWQ